MSSENKMINAKMTVIQLKAAAKAQGIKGYSKLRKAESIQLVCGAHVGGANESILDSPVPDIQVPTLSPSPYVPTSLVRKIYDKTKAEINTFANWILNYIPGPVKKSVNAGVEAFKTKVNTIFNKLKKFEIRESNQPSKDLQNNTLSMEWKA